MNFEIINTIFHGNLNKILLFIEFKFYTLTFNSFDLLLLSATCLMLVFKIYNETQIFIR